MPDEIPSFPNYPPPEPPTNPRGLPMAHPSQYKPLAKLMKFMLKPRKTVKAPKPKVRWKRKHPYY